METGHYVLNGKFTMPTVFNAPSMNVVVHMKHETDTWEKQTNTFTRTIHYRRATDGMDVKDSDGHVIPDYQEQYEITPVITNDEVTDQTIAVTYKIKDLTTCKEWSVPVTSPTAASPWKAEESSVAGSVTLPSLAMWNDADLMWDSWNINQTIDYHVSYDNMKIGDYVPDDQIQWSTNIETSSDGTKETVYRYFYYGLTDDTGVNIDHPTKQYYGGRQSLQFIRDKHADGSFGQWRPVTTDIFPDYVYQDYYHPQGYGNKAGHAPALKYDPNDTQHNGDFRVFDPYSPLYKVSIIDDTTGQALKTYDENPVPEQGYKDTVAQAAQTNQEIDYQVANYLQHVYAKVSDDFGQISGQNADNAKHSEGTKEYAKYTYTIHLVQTATKHVDHKTVSRTIHFVADDGRHTVLQNPQQQIVHLTMTYYTDAAGNLVNVKKDAQGRLLVDVTNTDPVTKVWLIDATGNVGLSGNSFAQVKQNQLTNDQGTWYIERAADGQIDGEPLPTNYAPAQVVDKNAEDGTNEVIYLLYQQGAVQHIDHKTVSRTIHFVADDGHFTALQPNQEQVAHLSTTYYTDSAGRLVNVKKEAAGHLVVDRNNSATVQKVWSIDNDGNLGVTGHQFDQVHQDQIVTGYLPGTWVIDRASRTQPTGEKLATNYAPTAEIETTATDGSHDDIYFIYLQLAEQHVDHKTIKRTIHFVADDSASSVLKQPVEQLAHLTSIYYTNQNGQLVNVKTNRQGQVVIDPTNHQPVAKVWTIDHDGNSGITGDQFDALHQDFITDGMLPGTWLIKSGAGMAYAPMQKIDQDSDNGTNKDVFLVYRQRVDQPTTPPDHGDDNNHQPDDGGSTLNHGGHDGGQSLTSRETDRGTTTNRETVVSDNAGLSTVTWSTETASLQDKLPQTGNDKDNLAIAGLGLLSMLGLYGLRKKKRD